MKKITLLLTLIAMTLSASAFKQLSITEMETLLQKGSKQEAENYLKSLGWVPYKQTKWDDADMPAPVGSIRYAYSYNRVDTTNQAQGWAHIVAADSSSAPILVDTKNWDAKAFTTFTTGIKSKGYKLYKTYKIGPGTVTLYSTDKMMINIFEWTNGSHKERVISLYVKGSISDREFGEKTIYNAAGKRLMTFNLIKAEIKGPVTVYADDKPMTAMTWKYSGAFTGKYFLPEGGTTPVEDNVITNMYMRNDGKFVELDSLQKILIKKIKPDSTLNHFEYEKGVFNIPFVETGYEYPPSTKVYYLKEKNLTGYSDALKTLQDGYAEYKELPNQFVKFMPTRSSNSYKEAMQKSSDQLKDYTARLKSDILSNQYFNIHNQKYELRSADTASLAKKLAVLEEEVRTKWNTQEYTYREQFAIDSIQQVITARESRMQETLSNGLRDVLKASLDTIPFAEAMSSLLADASMDWSKNFTYNDKAQLINYLSPMADMVDYNVVEVAPELANGIVDVLLQTPDSLQSSLCRMTIHMDKGLIDARGIIRKEERSNLEAMRAKLQKGLDQITEASKDGCADVLKTYRLQYSLIDRTNYFKNLDAYQQCEARLEENLKLQDACLKFINLRQQIAQLDLEIKADLKAQKNAEKSASYKALYKTFDLTWPANAKAEEVCKKLEGYLKQMQEYK